MNINDNDDEMAFLLHSVSDIYKKPLIPIPSLRQIDIYRLIYLSMKNNVGYFIFKKLLKIYGGELSEKQVALLQLLVRQGDKKMMYQKLALNQVKSSLNQYVAVKTYRSYSRIPNDIDILVPNLNKAINSLMKMKMKISNRSKHDIMLLTDNLIKIHVHDKLSWANSTYLDDQLIVSKNRVVDFSGVELNIPDFNADFLIHLAHINFEPLHFTLSDFLYLSIISPALNWRLLIEQTRKYCWERTFTSTIHMFIDLHHKLYEGACPFQSFGVKHEVSTDVNFILPSSFPKKHIINAFIEKKLFMYSLKKIKKVCDILIIGDTYSKFYEPPEYRLLKK